MLGNKQGIINNNKNRAIHNIQRKIINRANLPIKGKFTRWGKKEEKIEGIINLTGEEEKDGSKLEAG